MIRDRVAIPSASYHVYAIAIHIKSAVCRSAGLSKQKCKIRQQSSFQGSNPLSCICSTVQHLLHSLRRARAASWTSCTHRLKTSTKTKTKAFGIWPSFDWRSGRRCTWICRMQPGAMLSLKTNVDVGWSCWLSFAPWRTNNYLEHVLLRRFVRACIMKHA
jgi:hypothetical protein